VRTYIKGRARGYLEGLEAAAGEVAELQGALATTRLRLRRAIGVVSDVERTRSEAAAVLDDHAADATAIRGAPAGVADELEGIGERLAELEGLQNEAGPRLGVLELQIRNFAGRLSRVETSPCLAKPHTPNVAPSCAGDDRDVEAARLIATQLRARGENAAAQMLENFSTCWWEAENRVRHKLQELETSTAMLEASRSECREMSERIRNGKAENARIIEECNTLRKERDMADKLRGDLARDAESAILKLRAELEVASATIADHEEAIDILQGSKVPDDAVSAAALESKPPTAAPPGRCPFFGEIPGSPDNAGLCTRDRGHPNDDGHGGHRADP
jgi:predicted nuclease with TOPRIM domain